MEPQNQSPLPEPGPKSSSRRDLTKLFCTIVLGIISISLAIGFAPVLTVLALTHRWVAHQFFETLSQSQPSAWFACGWIKSELRYLDAKIIAAFKRWAKTDHYWQ